MDVPDVFHQHEQDRTCRRLGTREWDSGVDYHWMRIQNGSGGTVEDLPGEERGIKNWDSRDDMKSNQKNEDFFWNAGISNI